MRANSSTSLPLCTTKRSHPPRYSQAFSVAGIEMPGRPDTNTGRGLSPSNTSLTSTSTTGPVQATSTTSGLMRSARRRRPRACTTEGGWSVSKRVPLTAAAIWPCDGTIGVRTTASVGVHPAGSWSRRPAAHFR